MPWVAWGSRDPPGPSLATGLPCLPLPSPLPTCSLLICGRLRACDLDGTVVRWSERVGARSSRLSTASVCRHIRLRVGTWSKQRPSRPTQPKPHLRERHGRTCDRQTAATDVSRRPDGSAVRRWSRWTGGRLPSHQRDVADNATVSQLWLAPVTESGPTFSKLLRKILGEFLS